MKLVRRLSVITVVAFGLFGSLAPVRTTSVQAGSSLAGAVAAMAPTQEMISDTPSVPRLQDEGLGPGPGGPRHGHI